MTDQPHAMAAPVAVFFGETVHKVLRKGGLSVTQTRHAADVEAAQRLRSVCFGTDAPDGDDLDARCLHFLVHTFPAGQLVCCFRLLLLTGPEAAQQSYSGRFYDLSMLKTYSGWIAELGRFCVHPDARDPDVLRVAWGALAAFVDEHGVRMLIGCSSFQGTDADPYRDSFAVLHARYLAPAPWRPGVVAPEVVGFAELLAGTDADPTRGLARMPSLLRSYLVMGGRVSDHAVVDRQMNTLHVFTGLEVAAIPPARKRLLRAVLAGS